MNQNELYRWCWCVEVNLGSCNWRIFRSSVLNIPFPALWIVTSMGRVYQGLGGAKPTHDNFTGAGLGGLSPPCMETFQYLNTLAFASNHSTGIVNILSNFVLPPHELDHPLFSPPMNWNQTPPMVTRQGMGYFNIGRNNNLSIWIILYFFKSFRNY